MKWLENNIAHLLSVIGLFLTFGGLVFVYAQLEQSNEHQKWNNYNQLNARYSELYQKITEELEADSCKQFAKVSLNGKLWIRSYFNLYSEEYYLYKENLIPGEMWTKRIDKGVEVNMLSYPVIIEGYEYWKQRGAFNHPSEFISIVDAKIHKLKKEIEEMARCKESSTPSKLSPTVSKRVS